MSKNAVSDDALSRALGVYTGMVSRVLNNPRRWLGSDEAPPLTAGPPVRILDAVRDRTLGERHTRIAVTASTKSSST